MTSPPVPAIHSLLRGFFARHPDEAAGLLESLPPSDIARVIATAPPPTALAVFGRLGPDVAGLVLERLGDEAARPLLEGLDPGRSASLLTRLDPEAREQRLALLSPGTAKELRTLMAYPPDSAGALMDTRITAFRADTIATSVIERLRTLGRRRVHDVLVVDGDGRLTGTVSLQDVALATSDERLADLAREAPISIHALAPGEEVVELIERHSLVSLPVVDIEGRLLGLIRHGALVKAVEQEVSADIQRMVGVSTEERALSKVSFAVRKRLPWLQINLATAFLAAAVVGIFESTIAQFTALAVLLPVVAGQSGNTGAQSLAVTMRGLALREIHLRHWPRVLFKETSVGVLNGIAVALVTAAGVYFWSGSAGLAFVIGLAMIISMAIAGIAGAGVPILLHAFGLDPAQSSSIVLTTVTDVTGFLSFLGLATVFASML